MRHLSRTGSAAGILLLAGLAGLGSGLRPGEAATSPAAPDPSQVQAAPVAAPYYYGAGAQGFGYYVAPDTRPAPARAPVQSASRGRPSTVGPGARNWATGNRVPLHRPWLRSRS
jgi:hypothetical protein